MALFDKMRDSISIAGQEVAQKTKNATENVRIGNQIKANERMIEKLTYQVGLQCVKNHIQEADSEYGELFAEILRLRKENQAYQEELQRLTAVNTCPQCGAGNKTSAKFCISCGAPMASAPAAPVDGKKCPGCGMVNEKDALFCVSCGSRLPEMTEEVKTPEADTAADIGEASAENVEPAAEETGYICKNCGAKLEEDMIFCVECGTKRE